MSTYARPDIVAANVLSPLCGKSSTGALEHCKARIEVLG